MKYRIEKDTIGPVEVPADKYWGPQTQRSRMNFPIGNAASMPIEIIRAFAYLKKAAAFNANRRLTTVNGIYETKQPVKGSMRPFVFFTGHGSILA